jgi:hypothetical protein
MAVRYVRRVRWVSLCADGLVWADADGLVWADADGRHEAHWDDVREVYRKEWVINGCRHTALTLRFTAHHEVVFDHMLADYNELAARVQELSARNLLTRLATTLKCNGVVQFGPVGVDPRGLSWKQRWGPEFFDWHEIDYAVDNGRLIVVPCGRRFTWNERREQLLSDIPNYLALLHLMAQLGKPPVPPAQTLPR